MILRKPYAFFIKHFKLFHLLMLIFLGVIVYRTNLVRVFFNEYLTETAYIVSYNEINGLFNNLTYIWGLIVIVFSIIVFLVMNKKEKPVVFYAINILIVFCSMIFIFYSSNIVYKMQSELISVTILRAIRDIANLLFMIQVVQLILTLVRAIGFDIKKFDFKRDLEELDISVEDSEEFEVQFSFDKNELKRKFKKNAREFKYFVLENKKMIVLFSIIFIVLLSIFIYTNFWKFSKNCSLNKFFTTTDFTMKVTDSFITSTDYKSNSITDNVLVIVRIETQKSDNIINTVKTQLVIDGENYYPVFNTYDEKLIDLGTVYNNEKLTEDSNKYILVYEIPEHLKDKKMTFVYLNNYSRTLFGEKYEKLKINLNSVNLDENVEQINSSLEKILNFDNQTIKGNFTIMNYEIKDLFISTYNTCVSKTECYELNQYLQPSFTGYQDKTIIKVNATLNYNEKSLQKYDLMELISKYGKIVYVLDNKTYETKDISSTNFSIVKDSKNYYLEIPKQIENASKIDIVINIRNKEYVYNLK